MKIQKPPDTIAFLRAMYRFKTKVEDRLTMPATEKLKRDVMQRNLKKTNQMLKDKLSEINQKLQEEKDAFQEIFHEKNEMKKHHQNELSLLKSECVTIIKKKIVASERQMMQETAQHQLEYERLVEREDKIKMEYEDMLKLHMSEEDTLRSKRFKIETTLTSWLQKYDKEVGDRQGELDELTRLYEEEKEALADLKRRFNEQEEHYTPLIKMKKDEEAAIFAYNFNRFRTNYAAKKIQRWWRAILKKSKKKKKKRR